MPSRRHGRGSRVAAEEGLDLRPDAPALLLRVPPDDPRLPTEPRSLALRESPRGAHRGGERLRHVQPSLEAGAQLAIAHGLETRSLRGEATRCERADLVEKPRVDHGTGTSSDALLQRGDGPREADDERIVRSRGEAMSCLPLGEAPPAHEPDL